MLAFRIADELQYKGLHGFCTEEIREDGERRGFRLVSFNGTAHLIAHVDFPKRNRVGKYGVDVDAPAPTVILIHGGGWEFGDLDTYDGFARQVAKRSGLRCLSIEYALVPEHPFPAPLDDCVAAVRWATSEGATLGIDPQRMAVIGDSSGAKLALGTCLAFRDAGVRPLRGAVLAYGAYSLDLDTPSMRDFGGGAYFLGTGEMKRYWHDYLPNAADRKNPLAVVCHRFLPPLCAKIAGHVVPEDRPRPV